MSGSTTQYPYDTVVYITDTIGGTGYQASGVLISPDEVLTASHVVFTQGEGSATNIVVTPGYELGYQPYGSSQASYFHYFSIHDQGDTISNFDSQYDYAVIHLAHPFTNLGYMGLQAGYTGGAVNVTGYPAYAGGGQIAASESVSQDPTYSLLDGTTIGQGSSGGPVWINENNAPYIVGLVSSSYGQTGFFTELTTSAFNQIRSWVNLDDANQTSTPGVVVGNASTIAGEFDALEAEAVAGKLTSITLTDPGVPVIELTQAQLLSDSDVMPFIHGLFNIDIAGTGVRGLYPAIATLNLGARASINQISFADGQVVYNGSTPVAQVTRLYQAALARQPDQAGLHGWTDFLKSGGALTDVANGFISSPEFQSVYGSLSDTAFVNQLYQNVLHRGADPVGLAGWTGALAGGATRAQVLVGFSESPENINNTSPQTSRGLWDLDQSAPQVARLYDTVLGRTPDPTGLAQWEQSLDSGALTLQQVAADFVAAPEFVNRYGALGNSDFVTALYQNSLHRGPDPTGLAAWTTALNTGALSRAGVVLGFSESAEHQANTAPNILNSDPASYGVLIA